MKTGESYLFFPRYPPEYGVWMGPLITLSEFKEKYGVTFTYYVDEVKQIFNVKIDIYSIIVFLQLDKVLQKLNRGTILTLVILLEFYN